MALFLLVLPLGSAGCSSGSGGGGNGAGGGGASSGGASSGGASSGGASGLPACVGVCVPESSCDATGCKGFELCQSDADCPATDKNYTANGPRCVSTCGVDHLCRTPCTQDSDCPSSATACVGVADDGTRYCEIGLKLCVTDADCGDYLRCWPSFRPANTQ